MGFPIPLPSDQGFRRLAVVLGLVTFLGAVAYFMCDAWKPGEEDAVAISAQIYEDQVHECTKGAGSNSSECMAKAEKSYRSSANQIYRPNLPDTLMDWSVYVASSSFLSFLVAFAVRTFGFISSKFAGVTAPLIPDQKRLVLRYEAPLTIRPFNDLNL